MFLSNNCGCSLALLVPPRYTNTHYCCLREDTALTDAVNSGSSKSGGAPSQLTATFISSLLQSGDLQHHIVTTLQPAYARRYYSLMSAIEKYLIPLGVELPQEDRDHMGYVRLRYPTSSIFIALRQKACHKVDSHTRLVE